MSIKNKFILFFFLIQCVAAFDVSSNFLFETPPFAIPLVREILTLFFGWFCVKESNVNRDKLFALCTIFFIIGVLIGFIYGLAYTYYIVRVFVLALSLSLCYVEIRYMIGVVSIFILFYLFSLNFYTMELAYVIQGNRFFAANASVVSLLAIYLTIFSERKFHIFGFIAGILTGSTNFYVYVLLKSLGKPIFIIFGIVSYFFLFNLIEDTEAYRRLNIFIDLLTSFNFLDYLTSSTFDVRLDQVREVMTSNLFNPYIGAPITLLNFGAGIESQAFFIWSYGGFLGLFLFFLFALCMIYFFKMIRATNYIFLFILILYSLSFRWLESYFSVLYIILISLELFFIKNFTFKRGIDQKLICLPPSPLTSTALRNQD
jgi:hypothetical protein